MSVPFFSIIVPVYNVQEYLEKCVRSVLTQSFNDFECILIDDGSTDGSPGLCDCLAENDCRIRTVHKQNEGVAIARNVGIRQAKGSYLLFLDSDDTFSQDLLKNIADQINSSGCDIVVFGYRRITENNVVFKELTPPADCTVEMLTSKLPELFFLLVVKAYRRELFERINLEAIRGITFSEDSYLTLALQKAASSTEFIRDIGYNYLCRKSSVTQNMTEKNFLDRLKAVELMDALYSPDSDKPPVLNEIKFSTKFFYIDPNAPYAKGRFFMNCKLWRRTFPETNSYAGSEIKTGKMRLYVICVRFHIDFAAYLMYALKNRTEQNRTEQNRTEQNRNASIILRPCQVPPRKEAA